MLDAGIKNLNQGQFVELGKVGRAFGLRGELRIYPHNPLSDSLEHLSVIYLVSQDDIKKREFKIIGVRRMKDFFLVKLEGIETRTQAEGYRNWKVLVDKSHLPVLPEGEYYWFQLIGLKVVSENGEEKGEVIRLEETNRVLGGNDILVVSSQGKEVLIPFCASAVERVELEKNRIIVKNFEDYKE